MKDDDENRMWEVNPGDEVVFRMKSTVNFGSLFLKLIRSFLERTVLAIGEVQRSSDIHSTFCKRHVKDIINNTVDNSCLL